jgi:predicted nucleotidyltransferase
MQSMVARGVPSDSIHTMYKIIEVRSSRENGASFDSLAFMRPVKSNAATSGFSPSAVDLSLAERFNRVLEETVEAMEESGIRYAFIGGVASGGLGRPRLTRDIDLFVMPEDAEMALQALAKKGFRTEKTDPTWLYKGFKEDILVDVIFKSKGEIYFDNEMFRRMITAVFHGKQLRLVAPEDLLIIKAAAHSEQTPNHWHDAIGLISHAKLDWNYLLRRARRAPRRILSLLLYAQSNDLWVPNQVIRELYEEIFAMHSMPSAPKAESFGVLRPEDRHGYGGRSVADRQSLESTRHYAVAHLRERLAEDPRTNELDIHIERSGDRILLRGEVQAADRRAAIEQIARECFPGCTIENQVRVLDIREPGEAEEIP